MTTLIPPWSQTLFGDRVPANPAENGDTRPVYKDTNYRVDVRFRPD